ncbi:MAG: hypothetical protein NXI16_16630 [Alphaproteobacteria bacterium]|nr:hypothetical protein [Alphaproteobacteria bacterium]
MLRSTLLAASVLLLNGCVAVSWPPMNGGGVAEIAPPERMRMMQIAASPTEQALLRELQDAEKRLEILLGKGAHRFAAAETTLAKRLCIRIRREVAGTLYSEAQADLIELQDRLVLIERSLAQIEPTQRGKRT